MKWFWTVALLLFALASCSPYPTPPEIAPVSMVPTATLSPADVPAPTQEGMPNPASAFCEEQGHKLEIRTAADGSQSSVCIFPEGTECDEWAYFRRECGPSILAVSPSALTALPIDPAGYQGWWTYTHPVYNFSIMLPDGWIVNQVTSNDPLMNGHMLKLGGQVATGGTEYIRMTFRRLGEDTMLWPTGVGPDEFIQQGTLDIAGQPARRLLLVCHTGEVTSI